MFLSRKDREKFNEDRCLKRVPSSFLHTHVVIFFLSLRATEGSAPISCFFPHCAIASVALSRNDNCDTVSEERGEGERTCLQRQPDACSLFQGPLIDEFGGDHIVHGNSHVHTEDLLRIDLSAGLHA